MPVGVVLSVYPLVGRSGEGQRAIGQCVG